MKKQWRLLSFVSLLALLLGGCGKAFQSTLIPQGEVAKMQYDLLLLASAIMVGVVLVVTIIFLYVIVIPFNLLRNIIFLTFLLSETHNYIYIQTC